MTSVTLLPFDEQPGRARRIPRRVAARLERGAHAARRKARGIGLALDQLLAAELGDRAAIGGRREKRVVLLRRDAGHRLEPVRVVRRAVLHRPVLQRGRDRVGRRHVERLSTRDRRAQRPVGRLGKALLLHLVAEDEAAEFIGGLRRRCRGAVPGHRPVTDALDGFGESCGSHLSGLSFLVAYVVRAASVDRRVVCADDKLCTTALSVCNIVAPIVPSTALSLHDERPFVQMTHDFVVTVHGHGPRRSPSRALRCTTGRLSATHPELD